MSNLSQRLKLNAWYQATRPRVFTASYVPMGLAAVIAIQDGVFNLPVFVLSLIGTMLLQTAANLVNEYADFRRGADKYKEAGQSMIIKRDLLSPSEIRMGAILSLLGGILIGLYLLTQSGPLLWIIGIGGVIVAITYTAGPFPLAYNGLGETAAGIFMGPMIVVGAYYVMSPDISSQKLFELVLQSFPVMFMVAAILHANNIRDLEADAAVNKRTTSVMFGRDFARKEYIFLVGGAYISLILLVVAQLMPLTALIALISVREARRLIHIFNTSTDVPLMHQAQGRTAKLHGIVGFWIVVGWAIWLIIQQIQ